MDCEFVIPLNFSDLRMKQGVNEYSVNEVYPSRILPNKLSELKAALRSFGTDIILLHFDSLYSILCEKGTKDLTLLQSAWQNLMKYTEGLVVSMKTHLDGTVLKDVRLRNATMMSVFLIVEYVDILEAEHCKPSTDQIVAGKKKRGKAKDIDSTCVDWNRERLRAIRTLSQLFTLPIQRLWDPPLVDQNLINCVGNCCFKLLSNAETGKMRETKEDIFRLLGTIVKRHKYGLTAAIQMLESLKMYEHMACTIAEALAVFAREYSCPKISQDVLREIGSLSAEYLQKDSAAARSYSTFLQELSEMLPDVMLPVISVLLPFLDNDPHTMRNAMLSVLGKLVMNLLTGDDLDDNRKNMREEFIETICEHMHDCNGFVRAKAIQVITGVVEARTLPVSHFIQVTELAKERLLDKLSNVRKCSMHLLTTLISHNPYGAKLSKSELTATLEIERKKMNDLMSQVGSAIHAAAVITPIENWNAMLPEILKAASAATGESDETQVAMDVDNSSDEDEETSESLDEICKELSSLISSCRHSEAVRLLLRSQTAFSDTLLELDFEDRTSKSEVVVEKLKEIFVSQKNDTDSVSSQPITQEQSELKERISQQQIVIKYLEETNKFCTFVQETLPIVCKLLTSKASTDVVESIQFVIHTVQFGVTDAIHGLATMLKLIWVTDPAIKTAVVEAFRKLYLYCEETGNTRDADRVVSSLISLTKSFGSSYGLLTSWEQMVAEFVRSDDITSKVLQLLWQNFTMKLATASPSDSKIALRIIAMAAKAKPGIIRSNMDVLLSDGLGIRASSDFLLARDVCFGLLTLAHEGDKSKPLQRYPPDNELVVKLISLMSVGIDDITQPGWIPLMEQAIKLIYVLTDTPDMTCIELIKEVYPRVLPASKSVNMTVLTRFVSLVGQVALHQMTYLEADVLQELKKKRQTSKDQANDSGSGGDELGQNTSDDLETEVVMKVIEHELLDDRNLIGSFLPLLTHIIMNHTSYDDKGLQAAATLALGKCMLISPTVCRQHLRLYFTILERSRFTEVKTNAIIALSDMVFRFPNELEPWTPNLYARLTDPSPFVRKSTLMVMTRLILNDMVKVKGQISEIAICLVDKELPIKQLAAQFFYELANKGRALYNVLLDIISRLSDAEVGVPEEQFQTICDDLFSHLNNDKQSESLMERFVLRFRATTDERQWRDLSYCLSKLTYSERSIKKLTDLFSCYGDKLCDEVIYDNFMNIINTATQKLKPKPGAKELLTELTTKIEHAHRRGVEDGEPLESSSPDASQNASISKKSRGASVKKPRRRTRSSVNSDEDSYDGESDTSVCSNRSNISVTQKPTRRSARSARKVVPLKARENLLDELQEESDEDLEITSALADRSISARGKQRQKLVMSSSEDEEEITAAAVLTPVSKRRSGRLRKK